MSETGDMLRKAADEIDELLAHVRVLEALRPVWSISEQVTAAALAQIWQELGVKNQTEAMIMLRKLARPS